MDREHLYRGKRKDNGEWVIGYYFCMHHNDGRTHIHHFIIPIDAEIPKDKPIGEIQVEVIPETVGEYTGEQDKNGKKIFEGDICRKFSNYSGKKIFFSIVFEQGLFYARYSETAGMPLCDICEKVEIIGNIHDNPELLEVAE